MEKEIKELYEIPEPVRKKEFLRQFESPYISMGKFMWEQLWYLKKWVWLLSGFLFVLIFWLGSNLEAEKAWVLYAIIPFLALSLLIESDKSNIHGMEELECATRFSLKSLLLARMGGLAGLHSAFMLLLLICLKDRLMPMLHDVLYMLVPYFLTVCLGFHILRKFRGKESVYLCMGASVLVSSLVCVVEQTAPFVFGISMAGSWFAAFAVIVFLTGRELLLFYRRAQMPA